MNRFKFRVWDNQQKRMFIPIGNLYPENPDDFNFPTLWQEFNTDFANVHGAYGSFPMKYWFSKDCIIQQFTGLLDKNGKEIYEGDIIKVSELDHNQNAGPGKRRILQTFEKAVVTWQNGSYFYNPIRKVGANIPHQLLYYGYDKEIIGNINENPEILDKSEKS